MRGDAEAAEEFHEGAGDGVIGTAVQAHSGAEVVPLVLTEKRRFS